MSYTEVFDLLQKHKRFATAKDDSFLGSSFRNGKYYT